MHTEVYLDKTDSHCCLAGCSGSRLYSGQALSIQIFQLKPPDFIFNKSKLYAAIHWQEDEDEDLTSTAFVSKWERQFQWPEKFAISVTWEDYPENADTTVRHRSILWSQSISHWAFECPDYRLLESILESAGRFMQLQFKATHIILVQKWLALATVSMTWEPSKPG